jgi:hypothetical protein
MIRTMHAAGGNAKPAPHTRQGSTIAKPFAFTLPVASIT